MQQISIFLQKCSCIIYHLSSIVPSTEFSASFSFENLVPPVSYQFQTLLVCKVHHFASCLAAHKQHSDRQCFLCLAHFSLFDRMSQPLAIPFQLQNKEHSSSFHLEFLHLEVKGNMYDMLHHRHHILEDNQCTHQYHRFCKDYHLYLMKEGHTAYFVDMSLQYYPLPMIINISKTLPFYSMIFSY